MSQSSPDNPTLVSQLFVDLDREIAVTRRVLERMPDEHFSWKPHEKSMSLGRLSMHVATILQWFLGTLETEFMDMGSPPKIRMEPVDSADVLKTFDENVFAVKAALAKTDEAALWRDWSVRNGDQVLVSKPRHYVLRVWCLNHLIHHRAQLCVYLRLLNLPVPTVYFMSADEPGWNFD